MDTLYPNELHYLLCNTVVLIYWHNAIFMQYNKVEHSKINP